ncbi:MAG: 2-C-methyl-D-erythritol 4-phosphate cytidylyltransferase, partial [Micrococcales bacterium]|nr:2-C-methyl-D-erythritol 4-phosphate cytidylyltransferase [Micrococcales bacterium]
HASGASATDDAALVEGLGLPVLVVPGHALAFKITIGPDLELAERWVARFASRPAVATLPGVTGEDLT